MLALCLCVPLVSCSKEPAVSDSLVAVVCTLYDMSVRVAWHTRPSGARFAQEDRFHGRILHKTQSRNAASNHDARCINYCFNESHPEKFRACRHHVVQYLGYAWAAASNEGGWAARNRAGPRAGNGRDTTAVGTYSARNGLRMVKATHRVGAHRMLCLRLSRQPAHRPTPIGFP
jgi:hypothetical protein